MTIVICGGGIIGSSIAYHLAQQGAASTVVERCNIACAASGKAGGFLAREWCDHNELGPLARKSFDMHTELSEKLPGCDYRRMNACAVTVKEGGRTKGSLKNLPDWMNGGIQNVSTIGTPQDVAQVHPAKLSRSFIDAAEQMAGTKIVIGTVKGINLSDDRKSVTGVRVDDEVIPADTVVIAMGPWSYQAADWLPIPRVTGRRAHSILLKPTKEISAHALFMEYRSNSRTLDPEIYPRPNGEVYMCGMSDATPLPDDPSQIQPNMDSCNNLKKMAAETSSFLADAEMTGSQACYLPSTPDGLPLIGKVPGIAGAYIATGHTCWGILNAPVTGVAMAELILQGQSSLDLSPFDPGRF